MSNAEVGGQKNREEETADFADGADMGARRAGRAGRAATAARCKEEAPEENLAQKLQDAQLQRRYTQAGRFVGG